MMDEGFVGLIFSVFNEDKSTKVSAFKGNNFSDCITLYYEFTRPQTDKLLQLSSWKTKIRGSP